MIDDAGARGDKPSYAKAFDDIQAGQLAAGVLYAAGGALAAGGLAWLIIELTAPDDAVVDAVVAPQLMRGGAGVTLGASF